MTAIKTCSRNGNLRGMKKPWEFDIPLELEDMTVRRKPNNATATRTARPMGHVSSQKKRYLPKHLQLHRIAVRPSILLLVLLAAFLLGIAIGRTARQTTTLAAPDDGSHVETVKRGFRNEVFGTLEKVVDRLCDTILSLTSTSISSISHRDWIIKAFN